MKMLRRSLTADLDMLKHAEAMLEGLSVSERNKHDARDYEVMAFTLQALIEDDPEDYGDLVTGIERRCFTVQREGS